MGSLLPQVNQSQYSCLHNALKCDGVVHCSQGQDEDPAICDPIFSSFRANPLCNRRLDDSWGWFASPLYPQPYPPNSNCSWVIHQLGTPGGTVIQLRVVMFTLSMTDQDVLTIFDGPDSSYAVLGSYSKLKTPPSLIESSGSWLNVVFHSKSGYSVPGFNFTYQLKGVCLPDQHRCRMENDCYSEQQRCNGVWDCPVSGIDELECPNCQYRDQHYCGLQTQCYKFSERCNGIAKCPNYADENGCSPNQCGSQNGTFLCDNRRCIYESWTCDHHDDCGDMSDEQNCSGLGTTKRVIIAAICGSMICALLLVILVGCSCKLYSLRTMDYSHHPRHESPMSRLYAELLRRRAPPPYHEAMLTSRNFDEVQQEYMEQLRNAASRRAPRGRSGRGNRRRSSRVRQDSGSNESVENSGDNPNQGVNNEGDNSNYASNSLQLCSIHEENETETLDHNGNESSTSTADLLPSDSESDYTDSGEDIDSNVDYHLQDEGNSGESGINANGLDNQGVDNDGENDDGDDDNILNSESLSARWQRNVDSDDTSDEECLLADDFELDRRTDLHIQQGQYNHDCDSLDTEASASILSMDTQETGVQDGDGNKEIDNEVNGESENSRNSTPKPENCHSNLLISGPGESMLMRVHSHSSLNSEGSETYSDSDVPLQRIGSF
ncbi:low-density lipoprotein receptor-related protein 12-like [Dreissena polymorpha]|uniref:low-density lipoprotein receptor-related protein 12-like n=1 Tax=Dreissena polymorpha TaxID=45954 RepID=UPI0022650F61|nr:low-density lipoprotein receptor-related protein 12-like [Dreissena polymorpha]